MKGCISMIADRNFEVKKKAERVEAVSVFWLISPVSGKI